MYVESRLESYVFPLPMPAVAHSSMMNRAATARSVTTSSSRRSGASSFATPSRAWARSEGRARISTSPTTPTSRTADTVHG